MIAEVFSGLVSSIPAHLNFIGILSHIFPVGCWYRSYTLVCSSLCGSTASPRWFVGNIVTPAALPPTPVGPLNGAPEN
jgi:hypothetical protein